MLRKAGWTVAIILLAAHVAAAQAVDPPEQIPLPAKPGITLEGPPSEAVSLFSGPRPASLFYADADFLLWWVNHGPAPTQLTTAPNKGLNANGLTGGVIGQPGTTVLFDGSNLKYGAIPAMRATVGVNLDSFWSLEAGGFLLPKQSINYANAGRSNGAPLLTIPFLDAATGQQSSLDISSQDAAFNPFLTGSIAIHSDLDVWGSEFNLIAHSIRTAERNVDLLMGFRTLNMTENLSISQTVTPQQTGDITLQFPTAGQGAAFYYSGVAGSPVRVFDRSARATSFTVRRSAAAFCGTSAD